MTTFMHDVVRGRTTSRNSESRKAKGRSHLARALTTIAVAGLGFGLPSVLDRSAMTFVIDVAIFGLFALSLGFLAGHVGLVSLAHGAFYGGTGYAIAIALDRGVDTHLAVLAALAGALALSLVIAAISVRVPGIGFAIVTLAFGQIAYLIVSGSSAGALFNGVSGLSVKTESFLGFTSKELVGVGIWPLVWGAVVVSVVALWSLRRSRYGVLLAAIKDNEERARFVGFDTYLPRVVAFGVTGLLAGAAGVLAAFNSAYVSPANMYWLATAYALIAALLGGTTSLAGPFLGAFAILAVQDRFATSGGVTFYVGLMFVVVFLFFPSGLTGMATRAKRWTAGRLRDLPDSLHGGNA